MAKLSKSQKRIERMADKILSVLAWLFVVSCSGLLVLGATGLGTRWHLDLQHLGFVVAMWIGLPLFIFWGGANGSLILWRQVVTLRAHKGKADGRAVALFVTFGIVGVCLLFGSIYLLIRIFSR